MVCTPVIVEQPLAQKRPLTRYRSKRSSELSVRSPQTSKFVVRKETKPASLRVHRNPMPSSAAASQSDDDDDHSPVAAGPSGEGSNSEDIDNDEDEDPEEMEEEEEVEEEEEEVEEEEEQEEQEEEEAEYDDDEEVEEDKDDEGVGDDPSDSPIAAPEDRNDVSQDMEFEGLDKHLRSGSSTLGKSEASLPSDTLAVEDSSCYFKISGPSNEQLVTPKGELSMNDEVSKCPKLGKPLINFEDSGILKSAVGEKDAGTLPEKKTLERHIEAYCDSNAQLSNSENMEAETTKPSNVTRKEVAIAISKEANGVLYSEEGIKHLDMQSEEDTKLRASRLTTSQIRLRSLSPDAELEDGNKRPAVICDFFAKGWCIKGTSCKFLHIKEHLDNTSQEPEGDVAAANQKSELLVDEGLRDSIERSSLSGFHDSLASSVGNSTSFSRPFSSERILPGEPGASHRWHQLDERHKFSSLQREDLSFAGPPDSQRWTSFNDDSRFVSSFKDGGRESLRQKLSADDYSNHASPIIKSSSPVFRNSLFPDYGSFSSGSVISTYRSSGTPYGMSLEEPASRRSQFSLNDHTSPVLSRYLNSGSNTSHQTTDPLDAQKLSGSDREFRASRSASLLQSSSPFSGSEPETVPPSSARHTTKFSSNDWEPSVPFRPSFFIAPPSISSPGSQYDPLRDSIEQPNILGRSFENSSYSRGASIPSTSHEQIFGDHALTGTLIPEYNADSSSPDKFHDSVLDKNNRSRRKDSFKTEAEAAGVSVSDWQNRNTVPKERKLSGPSHVKDISRTNRIDIGRDRRHQSDGLKHKKESKVDRGRQNNEMDVDHKTDGDVHKEPKALRHFRAALVEFVKELLKPTWREGHLSKDAHNMIVKRAVDKVLSTLQPHQIPSTMESTKQYLSSSRPKISKLVEGYADKYGKS